MTTDEAIAKLKTVDMWGADNHFTSNVRVNMKNWTKDDDPFAVIVSFVYAAQVDDGVEVLFFAVEPGCDTVEPAYEAIVRKGDDLFFGDGKTPLEIEWPKERE